MVQKVLFQSEIWIGSEGGGMFSQEHDNFASTPTLCTDQSSIRTVYVAIEENKNMLQKLKQDTDQRKKGNIEGWGEGGARQHFCFLFLSHSLP